MCILKTKILSFLFIFSHAIPSAEKRYALTKNESYFNYEYFNVGGLVDFSSDFNCLYTTMIYEIGKTGK